MKKLLLSLVMALAGGVLSASAENASITFSEQGYTNQEELTEVKMNDDVTLVFGKGSNSNTPKYFDTGTAARLYGGNTLTFKGAEGVTLTNIEIYTPSGSNALNSASTVTDGTLTIGTPSTWTGSANEFTLTQGGTSGHARITSIDVTYTKSDPSDPRDPVELSFDPNKLTVELGYTFEAPTLVNPANVTVSYSSEDESVAEVDATTGALTIKAIGTTTIKADFEGNDDYQPGSASYTLTVIAPMPRANSIAEAKEMTEEFVVNFPMTVGFVNNNNVFVTDGTEWIQIYGSNSCADNDIIPAGWTATYTVYSSHVPELMPTNGVPAATEKGEINFSAVSTVPTVDNLNEVLILQNVVFDAATPADKKEITGKIDGTTEVTLYNNYGIESVEAGAYDVKVVICWRSNAATPYVIAYEEASNGKQNPKLSWMLNGEAVDEVVYSLGVSTIDDLPVAEGLGLENAIYNSSDETVAKISNDGTIEVLAEGTTEITVSVDETDELNAGNATFTLIVVDPTKLPDNISATFDFTDFSTLTIVTPDESTVEAPEEGTGLVLDDYSLIDNDIVISFDQYGGQNGARIWNSKGSLNLRIYNATKMFITAPAGLTITTIKITGTGSQTSNWGLNLVEGGGTFEIVDNAHLWTAPETGNVNSVTFEMPSTVSGRTDIDKIEVEAKKIETGIANVSVEDENAPVEYYNLQGIRVANPENGLYIRRQGNTATKVLIK